MDIASTVAQALALDSVKNATSLNFESVIQVSFEVAGLVKKVGASSKDQNVALLVEVLDAVILHVKAKELALADPASATEIESKYDSLKETVRIALPVLFSHLPHLELSKTCLKGFSCCSSSAVVNQVEAVVASVDTAQMEKVEKVVAEVEKVVS
jgi:hypothetical protein